MNTMLHIVLTCVHFIGISHCMFLDDQLILVIMMTYSNFNSDHCSVTLHFLLLL